MLGQATRQAFRTKGLPFQMVVACSFGLLLGMASLWLSPLLALGAVAAPLLIYAILRRPEIGLLGILIATSSIVFENQLPLISAGGISLHIPDLLLLGLLGLIAMRWLVEPEFQIVRTPLDRPLLLFYGVMLVSTLIAVFQSSIAAEEGRRWIRVMSYYLTFFVVTNLVRERRQLHFLLNGLFLLATIVAAAMVMQFLLGSSVQLLPGRVESLGTQGVVFADITRILPPGWSIVLVSFVAILCTVVVEKFRPRGWLIFLQCGLLGMAILVTFLRSYWAALLIVLLLLVSIVRGVDRQRLFGWGLMILVLAAMILLFVFGDPGSRAARLVGASMHRLSTLGDSGTFQGQDSSLNWRMIENEYAFSTIASHPVIGLGMGVRYRPYDPRLDVPGANYDFRKHIHNGYLWILLDMGLLGFLAFGWLSLNFLNRGFRYWRNVADVRLKGVMLGFTLAYLAVLIAAVVNSTFVQWSWTPVLGIIMGTNEVILSKVRQEGAAA